MRKVWPDYTKACVTVDDGRRMCGSQGNLEINGQLQTLYPPKATLSYQKKLDCSNECRERWPGPKETKSGMKSACTHLNTNRKSKHYNQAVPCGYKWKGNRLYEVAWRDGLVEACAVDMRTW